MLSAAHITIRLSANWDHKHSIIMQEADASLKDCVTTCRLEVVENLDLEGVTCKHRENLLFAAYMKQHAMLMQCTQGS